MRNKSWLTVAAATLALAACNDGYNDNYGPVGPQANVQVIHASPDAPEVAVLIDGQPFIGELHYGEGTGEIQVPAGSHTLTVQALNPTGPATVIGPISVDLQQGNDYVVAAEGPVATITAQVYPHVLSTVAASSTRIQVVHAAPQAPAVDVYLTAPGAALASTAPTGSIAFMAAIGPTDVASGAYEIRITPAGAKTPVLYDSGTITLLGGTDLVISALQNTGPGTSPVVLGVVDAYGDNARWYDTATPANVRVVHDSPDAPAVSIIANGNTASPLVASLAYPDFTPYLGVTPGSTTIGIAAASTPDTALLTHPLMLNAGDELTVYAVNKLASLGVLVTADHRRRVATEAKLRIIHGSPSAGNVDVYLTATGAGIAAATPVYANVPFEGDTGFVGFTAGTYDVTITPAGSKTPAIGPVNVTLANSGVYTAVARDAAGGGAPFGLILLDDFAP